MHLDVARYAPTRSSLRARGVAFMAIGAGVGSVTSLLALIGLSIALERAPVHPRENLVEGLVVCAFGAIPTLLLLLLFVRGVRHWSNVGVYDRLVDLARRFPGIGAADAASRIGVALPKLGALARDGAAKGFIALPDVPVLFAVAPPSAPGSAPKALYSPGRTPLLAVLVSYATGVASTVIIVAAMSGKPGSTHSGLAVLVGMAATLTTAVLDLVGVVGGIASVVAARRMEPPASATSSVLAIVLGVFGFVGVLALAALTVINVL